MTGDPRRFTGKELDPETAQHYFGARYYRNVWGRFTSVDPLMDLEQNIVDPQGWNRYSYVSNRPTRIVDPDGRGWLSNAVKLVRAIAKGGNIAAEFQGVIDDANTVFSGESSFGQKVLAAASLATEVLSPVSARDAKGVVQAVVRRGDDAADAAKTITRRDSLLGSARDPGLRDAVDQLFRPTATIGDGSSMAAYAYERATGQLLSPTGHRQKLVDRLAQLQGILRRKDLAAGDRAIAEQLMFEIQSVLK
jgi:RHS repeat-associated protein